MINAEKKGRTLQKLKGIPQKLLLKVTVMLSALMMLPSMAAATTVNFSSVVDILNATVDIFPPLVDIIIAVVPVLIIVAIVAFVMGLFGAILGGITDAFRGLK